MENFTSPYTGNVYEISSVEMFCTEYPVFGDGSVSFERNYTEYRFYRDGKMVTWTYDLDPEHLRSVFGEIEGVYAPWTTSPWD